MTTTMPKKRKGARPTGFQLMTPEDHLAISRRGGQRGHELGVAFEFDRATASKAGRKGMAKRWGTKPQRRKGKP